MEHAVLNVPERNFELLVPPRMLFEDRRHSVADCQRGQFIEAAITPGNRWNLLEMAGRRMCGPALTGTTKQGDTVGDAARP
jgi:hypothetical protein